MLSRRNVLKSGGRLWQAGWILPLVLLALPNCAFHTGGLGRDDVFQPGDIPRSGAIMCDIPKVPDPTDDGCAAAGEDGMSMAHAAVALAEGQFKNVALDFSEAATSACNGQPKKTTFHGPFPDGTTVCLNCLTQIPAKYVDANAACVDKCVDMITADKAEPAEGVQKFCAANAHVSTNFDKHSCFGDHCSFGGTPNMPFDDPRRDQEPVKWTDLQGDATAMDNTLQKVTGTGTPADPFDSGAASDAFHTIQKGDAWVEFGAGENGVSHVLGVSHVDANGDTDPSLADIGFAISLNFDNNVYILENGANYVSAPLDTYTPNDRFRIKITDNNNGTATISYVKLDGVCQKGTPCKEILLGTQTQPSPKYPLRIDASFREPGAHLTDVTMVYIEDLK